MDDLKTSPGWRYVVPCVLMLSCVGSAWGQLPTEDVDNSYEPHPTYGTWYGEADWSTVAHGMGKIGRFDGPTGNRYTHFTGFSPTFSAGSEYRHCGYAQVELAADDLEAGNWIITAYRGGSVHLLQGGSTTWGDLPDMLDDAIAIYDACEAALLDVDPRDRAFLVELKVSALNGASSTYPRFYAFVPRCGDVDVAGGPTTVTAELELDPINRAQVESDKDTTRATFESWFLPWFGEQTDSTVTSGELLNDGMSGTVSDFVENKTGGSGMWTWLIANTNTTTVTEVIDTDLHNWPLGLSPGESSFSLDTDFQVNGQNPVFHVFSMTILRQRVRMMFLAGMSIQFTFMLVRVLRQY